LLDRSKRLGVKAVSAVLASGLLLGCSKAQPDIGAPPDARVSLSSHGLPADFFQTGSDKCAGQIIGYRFVVWLNNDKVAVGFNISPNCRQSRDRKVDGMVRIVVFDLRGTVVASRDIPYLADGYGEMVADGEAEAGPGGTLLFRIQSVNLDPQGTSESKSAVLLLDANLKDVARFDRFLEQTTFLNHALVFQEGFTINGPRTYSVLDGSPPAEVQGWTQDWPAGTMDRKFGEHQLAYMLCRQVLRPNVYSSTNIIYAGAKRQCSINVEAADRANWSVPLREEGTAALVGFLNDGSVAGQINVKGSPAGRLVIWKKNQTTVPLPWISHDYSGSIVNATADMSRYATFANRESASCVSFGRSCSETGRWIVFDRNSEKPLVDRSMQKNGRATLSPNGLHYASFESGELRVYSLPPR
jgi:hypothetical protein